MVAVEYIKAIRGTRLGGVVLSVLFYLIIIVITIKITNKIIDRIIRKSTSGKTGLHWKLMRPLTKVVILILGILGMISSIPSLDKVGTAIIASSSVIVAAIGLAAQETIANSINGVVLTIFKPFIVGDRIRLSTLGITGIVEDINLRHVVIRTFENNIIMIPNSTINKENIENYNYLETKVCNFLDIKIKYSSNINRAIGIFEEVVKEHPLHLDIRTEEEKQSKVKEVNVLVRNLSETGIELRAGIWSETMGDSFQVCSDIRKEILKRYNEEGIEIATPVIKVM